MGILEKQIYLQLKILNFKGQSYNNSYFAGAIYNTNGTTNISNSAFVGNYADSQGINFAVAGALYNMNNGTVSIDSSLFSNNYTYCLLCMYGI